MVVLFCGSRSWSDPLPIRRDMAALPDDAVVIEGGAPGADRLARVEALRRGLHVATVPALWDLYGRGAGHKRNAAMLRLSPVIVYAYNAGTRGTDVMVRLARAAGIPVHERRP